MLQDGHELVTISSEPVLSQHFQEFAQNDGNPKPAWILGKMGYLEPDGGWGYSDSTLDHIFASPLAAL